MGKSAGEGSSTSRAWHALGQQEVERALEATSAGLTTAEAAARLQRFGPNALPARKSVHPLVRFLAQFNNVLIWFLLAAAVAAILLGHIVDGVIIVIVVIVNAIVGFVQEGRAEQALEAIRDLIAPHATVLRDGARHTVDARSLVPGDVVLLEAGDKVPADIRILRARGMLVDEAILTGESVPAEKTEAPVSAEAVLAERSSMLHSGTLIATGQATGIVVATGAYTEIGHISSMLGKVETLTTPLLRQINHFGALLTWFAIGTAVLVFLFALFVRNYAWVDGLMVVVALAVGFVPEGLPAVITITLAIGVQRMASRNAVVRRLPAVETLGSTSVICSDKTGTLTRNEMTVRRIVTAEAATEVTGSGYAPEGEIRAFGGGAAPDDTVRNSLIRAGVLCNDAAVTEQGGQWQVLGDPMEGALVTLALKAKMGEERGVWQRLDEIPFDAEHRFMAVLVRSPDGEKRIFVKGAPERIMDMCAVQAGPEGNVPLDTAYWEERISEAASGGERVLAFAARVAPAEMERLTFADVEQGLVLLGIAGFIDPPRPEAIDAVRECRSAGISVKMITGDHRGTALAIARQLELADEPEAIEGRALDDMDDARLQQVASRISVFSRATPEHKLRIVRALQANGEIVAMTGDGVNDAPAVRQADVGVAMGQKGTEAAKEAAEMVLVDDNFASIVAAVHEGRTVYDNIRKVITWTLPTNGGEALCVIIAILLGLALPMTPVQILWINLVLTVTLGLVLAFEPPEPDVMRRAPRLRDAPILSPFLVWRIAFVSALFCAGVFAIYNYGIARGASEEAARTMVVNALVVLEIFYLFNVRYLHRTSFSLIGAMGTPAVLGAIAVVVLAQVLFTYAPFMHTVFGSAPVTLMDSVLIILLGVLLMLILEGEKMFMRRFMPHALPG